MADLDIGLQLQNWLAPLINQLSPTQRRTMARKLAVELRKRNAKRIAAQQNPDGSAFEPRKAQPQKKKKKGKKNLRARRMFSKLRQAKHMRAKGDADAAIVAFADRTAGIAAVHHYGLRDRVNARIQHQYAARQLLGIPDADIAHAAEVILGHLGK